MQKDRRVITRKELVQELESRLEDVTQIGSFLKSVQSAFILQSDNNKPVYIFEVKNKLSVEDARYLNNVFSSLNVSAALIPCNLISYVGEVTSDSFKANIR